MDALEDMKTNLYNLNYPGINTMSDESIALVFGSANRLNFLTWVYKQLETEEPLPSQENAKYTALAEIMYGNGFCSSSEKMLFVKGDKSLDPVQQIQICQRIFIMLNVLKANQENLLVSKPAMNLADLDSFLNQDLNLFPEFGIMKTKSNSERKQTIDEYKEKIISLQEDIRREELAVGTNVNYDTSEKRFNGTIVSELENEVIKFKENKEDLDVVRENKNIHFKIDNLEPTAAKCDEALGILVQYSDNVQVMNKFEDNLSKSTLKNESNSNEKLIEELCKFSNEVVSEY